MEGADNESRYTFLVRLSAFAVDPLRGPNRVSREVADRLAAGCLSGARGSERSPTPLRRPSPRLTGILAAPTDLLLPIIAGWYSPHPSHQSDVFAAESIRLRGHSGDRLNNAAIWRTTGNTQSTSQQALGAIAQLVRAANS